MSAAFTLPGFRGIARVALAFAAALAMAGPASAQYAEGKEFLRFKQPLPVETGKKIEVIEFFSYGCPHCADLSYSTTSASPPCGPTAANLSSCTCDAWSAWSPT